jgi:outer membrane lipoprotein-sorting protein
VLTATFQLDPAVPGAGGMEVKETEKWVAPTFLRQDNSLPNGTIQVYCDGKSGWISSGRGTTALVNPQLKKVQGDVFRNYLRMLLSDHIEGRVVNAVDQNTVEIREGDNTARMTFDPQTGLPKKLEYEAVVLRGAPDSVEETYSDYREAGGIKLPFRIEITQGGKKYAQVTVQDWKLNTGLKAEELAKRP